VGPYEPCDEIGRAGVVNAALGGVDLVDGLTVRSGEGACGYAFRPMSDRRGGEYTCRVLRRPVEGS